MSFENVQGFVANEDGKPRRRRRSSLANTGVEPITNAASSDVEPLVMPTTNVGPSQSTTAATGLPDPATPPSPTYNQLPAVAPAPTIHGRVIYEEACRMEALGKDLAEYATNLEEVGAKSETVDRLRNHAEALRQWSVGLISNLCGGWDAAQPIMNSAPPAPLPMPNVMNAADPWSHAQRHPLYADVKVVEAGCSVPPLLPPPPLLVTAN